MKKMAIWTVLVCMVLAYLVPSSHAQNMTGSLTKQTYSIADTDKLYLTIVGPKEDAKFQELVSTFASKPEFAVVKDESHYHALATESKMFNPRYINDYKAFPAVRVQTIDGTIVKEWAGTGIPDNATLLSELQCLPHWRDRRNPKPNPTPAPQPAPTPQPAPAPAPQSNYLPFWIGCAALACGLVFAFVQEASKN